jgi:hypothetical protein
MAILQPGVSDDQNSMRLTIVRLAETECDIDIISDESINVGGLTVANKTPSPGSHNAQIT